MHGLSLNGHLSTQPKFKTKHGDNQGQIQDLIRGGAPDRDRPKTAILGPQFCRILVLGPHFWWSGGGPGAPPGSAPG